MTKIVNGKGQRLLLVGESAPEGIEAPHWLLPGVSSEADFLLPRMGITAQAYVKMFARTYLLDETSSEVPVNYGKARASAEIILRHSIEHKLSLLFLGKRAGCLLPWGDMPLARVGYLHWYSVNALHEREASVKAAILPDPYEDNPWWADSDNAARAHRFFFSLSHDE